MNEGWSTLSENANNDQGTNGGLGPFAPIRTTNYSIYGTKWYLMMVIGIAWYYVVLCSNVDMD